MAGTTTYLKLLNGVATSEECPATAWNKAVEAQDRAALMNYQLLRGGRDTGWAVTSGTSTITTGQGQVGPCWCVTAASQVVSGLLNASTNYVFAKTDAGSPGSGTVDFVARNTSTSITNDDGVTSAILLGGGDYVATTGFTSVDTSIRTAWTIDHGWLSGLADDDHPEYMRDVAVSLFPASAVFPATSGASLSATYGSNFPAGVVEYNALSTMKAGWDFLAPADYSGAITVYTDWVSSGLAGDIRLGLFARNIDDGETWDAALTSCAAGETLTLGGSNGQLKRFSHSWSATLPAKSDRGSFVVRRDGNNASDNMTGTARLLSTRLVFSTGR